ncbi:glycosyltransferase [Reichenbachiella agarivorans]|uniref:Glycosyltransferase n=1 Tax=Reichenbachiella agarivorans TaxID=2979464 RepID=A0ABY6CLU4_9BACT|nr:glycosyltransferase [Reichenbachiella agarivorans]UXP31481.1 glycosyltransferase [Reichenbachiella agarivorans]
MEQNNDSKRPKVSIILPYFNAESTIVSAVKSILHQDYDNLELLLINNNSTDSSLALCENLSLDDTRIRLLSESQQGVVFAANLGLKHATGAYIARMDADDLSHPQRISKQLYHLQSNPHIDISACCVDYKNKSKLIDTGFEHFVNWSNSVTATNEIKLNRFVEFPVVNPTLFFTKDIANKVGNYREGDFPEDYEWFLRALELGCRIEKLKDRLLTWYDSPQRLTRSDDRYRTEAFFTLKSIYLAQAIQQKTHEVWIWGAGKLALTRSKFLEKHGIVIRGYIDIKKNKQIPGYECVHFHEIDLSKQPFIVSYITNRGRRDEVRGYLNEKGYKEGTNYLIAG